MRSQVPRTLLLRHTSSSSSSHTSKVRAMTCGTPASSPERDPTLDRYKGREGLQSVVLACRNRDLHLQSSHGPIRLFIALLAWSVRRSFWLWSALKQSGSPCVQQAGSSFAILA